MNNHALLHNLPLVNCHNQKCSLLNICSAKRLAIASILEGVGPMPVLHATMSTLGTRLQLRVTLNKLFGQTIFTRVVTATSSHRPPRSLKKVCSLSHENVVFA